MTSFDVDLLEWSHDLALRDFVEFYGMSYLPQLVRTTSGYSDVNNVNDIAAEEVFWVFDIIPQQRVMAKTTTGEHVSIPRSYELKFQKLNGSSAQPGPPVSLDDLVKESRFKGQTIQLAGANTPIHNFSASASSECRKLLSQLKLKDIYSEKYLAARSVLDSGDMSDIVLGIPVYLPITVQVAVGIKGETNGWSFVEWSQQLAEMSDAFQCQTTGVMCEDILVFDDLRTSDYEYVNPSCNATVRYANWKQTWSPPEHPQRHSSTSNDDDDTEGIYDDALSLMAEVQQKNALGALGVQQTHSSKQTSVLNPDTLNRLPTAGPPTPPVRSAMDSNSSKSLNLTDDAIEAPDYDDDDEDDGHDYEEIPETYPKNAHAAAIGRSCSAAGLDPGSTVEQRCWESYSATLPASKKAQIGTNPLTPGLKHNVPQPATISSPPTNSSRPTNAYWRQQSTETLPSVTDVGVSNKHESLPASKPTSSRSEPIANSMTRSTPNLCADGQSVLPTQAVIPFHNTSVSRFGNHVQENPPGASSKSSTLPRHTATVNGLNVDSSKSETVSRTATAGRSENGSAVCWRTAADIPTNVGDFSVDELSRALELLQMPRIAELFRDQFVDGSLLLEIATEDSLVADFHCKVFEARKLIQFAKHNWRPKI